MGLREKDIKKTISFTTVFKKIKYLEINLTKEEKNLYEENYKTLIKEGEEDINRKIFYVHKLEELIFL